MLRFMVGIALGGLIATLVLLWYIWRAEEKSAPDHVEWAGRHPKPDLRQASMGLMQADDWQSAL